MRTTNVLRPDGAMGLRLHGQALPDIPAELRVAMTRLAQTLMAEPAARSPRTVMFTGAAQGVGTSYVLNALAGVAPGLGHAVGSLSPAGAVDTSAPSGATARRPGGDETETPQAGQMIDPLGLPKDAWTQALRDAALDLVLVDAPPIAQAALAMRLAPVVDGVVLVVAAERSTEAQIRAALDAIATCGGHCLGLVLNKRRRLFS